MDTNFHLDWLSFSWFGKKKKCLEGVQNCDVWAYDLLSTLDNFLYFFPEFKDYLASEDIILSDKGGGFYSSVYILTNNIRISFNDDDSLASKKLVYDVGINVSIPSHALEWFYDLLGVDLNDICSLMRVLTERNCVLSRIDLAFDDFEKKYMPLDYFSWFEAGCIRSRYFQFCDCKCSTRERGHTCYFGTRSGGRMLRIYDKEYQSKGAIPSVRYEFELHSDYAKGAQLYFLEHDTVSFSEYLLSYFQVIDLTEKNVSRCPINEDWLNYLLEKDRFNEQLIVPTKYSRSEREFMASQWLERCCMRDIKGYITVFGLEVLLDRLRSIDKLDIPIKYKVLLE